MSKVIVNRTIILTEEEKNILIKAKEILRVISDELDEDWLSKYENHEYISDILDIWFEY